MKITSQFLFAAVLTLGASAAVAQDDRKPAPPGPPPAADGASPRPPEPSSSNPPVATPPNPATSPAPPPPGSDGRRGDRHGDFPRSPEVGRPGWHHPPGGWPSPPPPAPPKPTSYIGVITTPPPAVLTAQLGLAEGFGLVVGDVLPDSPAAKAGIQRYDVLTKFNDQQLVDSSQFSTLVRALKKDTEASVTLIRKAQEQKVTVTIEERLLPERRSFPIPGGDFRHSQGMQENGRHLQDRALNYGEKMRDYQERMLAWKKNPSAEKPQPPQLSSADSDPAISPEDILREVRPGGVAQIRLLKPDGNVTYNMANARLMVKDETGETEMTIHDGKRSLVARNAQGETIFDGPIDTEEQRKALPEDVRKKIELIEVQRKLAETPAPPASATGLEPDVQ